VAVNREDGLKKTTVRTGTVGDEEEKEVTAIGIFTCRLTRCDLLSVVT
jgi:hypothetical protein